MTPFCRQPMSSQRQHGQESYAHLQQYSSSISTSWCLIEGVEVVSLEGGHSSCLTQCLQETILKSDCQPTYKVLSKNLLLIIILHIYTTYQYVSQGNVTSRKKKRGRIQKGLFRHKKRALLLVLLGSFSPQLFFSILVFVLYFLKGVSLPMLCQKVEVLRLGSASMKTCCWGKAVGREGCFCRSRKSQQGLVTAEGDEMNRKYQYFFL